MAALIPILLPHIIEAGVNIGARMLGKLSDSRDRRDQCHSRRFVFRLVPDRQQSVHKQEEIQLWLSPPGA